MNKNDFLSALREALRDISRGERDKWLDFYSEMIDDRMDEGLTEETAVAAVGAVETVAAQILEQTQPVQKRKKELKTWHWVLLIVGSPVWFALLVAAAAVIFSLTAAAWAVVISFYAVAVSLAACSLAGFVLAMLFLCKGNAATGLFCFGAFLFCAGLCIFWFIGTLYLTRGVIWLCKKLFTALIPGKEAAV